MERKEEVFENTFAKECGNSTLTLNEIIGCMKFGVFKYDSLPAKVQDAVDRELEREDKLRAKYGTAHPDPNNEYELDVLDLKLEFSQHKTEQSPVHLPLKLSLENCKHLEHDLIKDNNGLNNTHSHVLDLMPNIDKSGYTFAPPQVNSKEGRPIVQFGQGLSETTTSF